MNLIERYNERETLLNQLMEYESRTDNDLYEFISANIENFKKCCIYFDVKTSTNRVKVVNTLGADKWPRINELINRYQQFLSKKRIDEKLQGVKELVGEYNKQRPILTVTEFCSKRRIDYNCFCNGISLLEKSDPNSEVYLEYITIKQMVENETIRKLKRLLMWSHLIKYAGVISVVEEKVNLSVDEFSVVENKNNMKQYFTPVQIQQIENIRDSYFEAKRGMLEWQNARLEKAKRIFDEVMRTLNERYLREACACVLCDNGERLTVEKFEKEILPLIKSNDGTRFSQYQQALETGKNFRKEEDINGLRALLDIEIDLMSFSDEELFNYINSMYPDSYRIPFIGPKAKAAMSEFTEGECEILFAIKNRYSNYNNRLPAKKRKKLSCN